jgi:D-ribose pyranase
MKKTKLLNQEVSYVIAGMGHKDMLVIADAGLPIPENVLRIDLALSEGIPSFMDTVHAVNSELAVESIIVSEEMQSKSPQILSFLTSLFPKANIQSIPHEEFKAMTSSAKAVIRTGEFTPYANVILVSGVVF